MGDRPADRATESHILRLQQCFLLWLAENAHRFATSPQVTNRTESEIEMSLVGLSPAVTARLTADQLFAEAGGTVLICFDLPRRCTGYTCGAISPLHTRVDGTDEGMWSRYFERFLAWENRQLGRPVNSSPDFHNG